MIVVFRADGSSSLGGGHLYRCCALAQQLQEGGAKVVMASSRESYEAFPWLEKQGFETLALEPTPEPEAVQIAVKVKFCDWLVVDHYQRGSEFETSCRVLFARRILSLDDRPHRFHDCDLLLDPTLHRGAQEYFPFLTPSSQCLLGPQYALLRPQFAERRRRSLAKRRGPLKRLLVMPGATDPLQLSSQLLEILSHWPDALEVDVVGPAPQVPSNYPSRIQLRIHHQLEQIAALLSEVDLVLGAAGSASWERCCLGLPSLVFVVAENQREIAATLQDYGAARWLGEASQVDQSKVLETLLDFRSKPQLLLAMSQKAAALCDGLGCSRVAARLGEAAMS